MKEPKVIAVAQNALRELELSVKTQADQERIALVRRGLWWGEEQGSKLADVLRTLRRAWGVARGEIKAGAR